MKIKIRNIFKPNRKSEYHQRLKESLPKELHVGLHDFFKILAFKENNGFNNLIHETELTVQFHNETLIIPYRLYFKEPNPKLEKSLTNKQRDILNCIYLRHYDGFIREKRLKLISDNPENWTVPFIIQLVGEYVYELLPIINNKINEHTLKDYLEFINENPKYWQQIQYKMINYWNVIYRYTFPKLKEYLGHKIVKRIKKANRIKKSKALPTLNFPSVNKTQVSTISTAASSDKTNRKKLS